MNYKKIIIYAATLGVIVAGWFAISIHSEVDKQLKITAEKYILNVESGSNLTRIVYTLRDDKVIENPKFILWYAKLYGLAVNVHIGEYALTPDMTIQDLLQAINEGKVIQYSFTIIEGWSFKQLIQAINNDPHLSHKLKGMNSIEIMDALGYSGQHPEGRFLPDTYLFPKGMSDIEFLQRSHQAMEDLLSAEWDKRDLGLPIKTPYEAIILASIVEKETGQASERSKIAGIFNLRLIKRMRLQTDPTVIYGMGERYKGNIRTKDLKQDTPYNSYTRYGLPPTPIAMPGRDAILAVLHPEGGGYLYFVAKGDGSHYFSKTLEEHNRAVVQYQLKGKKRPFSSSNDNGK